MTMTGGCGNDGVGRGLITPSRTCRLFFARALVTVSSAVIDSNAKRRLTLRRPFDGSSGDGSGKGCSCCGGIGGVSSGCSGSARVLFVVVLVVMVVVVVVVMVSSSCGVYVVLVVVERRYTVAVWSNTRYSSIHLVHHTVGSWCLEHTVELEHGT